MRELVADAAFVGDVARPGDHHAIPSAAKERGDLFPSTCMACRTRPSPRYRVVWVGIVGAPGVVELGDLS